MPKYLRDMEISDVSIDSNSIAEMASLLRQRGVQMPEFVPVNGDNDQISVFLSYTVRFDEKGYRTFDEQEMTKFFAEAKEIERVTLDLRSAESLRTNTGSYAVIRLEGNNSVKSFLTVDSDSEEWVNSTFNTLQESLSKRKNNNARFRNAFTELLLQLFGVLVGFFIALWGAAIVAPRLNIENAFLISFFLVLLLFSNLWSLVKLRLSQLIDITFPSVKFSRPNKDKFHWILQAVVGGVVVAVTLYLLSSAFRYIGVVLEKFIQ